MYSFIITILSIALMAISLLGGLNYVNTDEYKLRAVESVVSNDLYSYGIAIESHEKMYNYYPKTSDIKTELEKVGFFLPEPMIGVYSYNNDTIKKDVGICYSLGFKNEHYKVLRKIKDKGTFVLATECFSYADNVVPELLSDGDTITLTRWIYKN